jgi:hypothetical protein
MAAEAPDGGERRFGKRLKLPVTVRARLNDGPPQSAKVRDVNARGLSLESLIGAQVGDRIAIDFDGYPGVCDAFGLTGQVVRILDEIVNGVGIEVNRKANTPEAVQSYKTLVLHYLHHRPLLDDVGRGYFEGRCTKCGWVGRVGARAPKCSRCGGTVEPIRA